LKIAFIGDIVGRPARKIIKENLKNFINKYNIDYVIANGENASHGFGLGVKNCDELRGYGIDMLTGGNHSFDKKSDMLTLLEQKKVLRPDNYPSEVPGSGLAIVTVNGEKLAIVNLMGVFTMPMVLNPFIHAKNLILKLKEEGIKNIFVDFHAEASSEKRILFMMLKGKISALCGTHTHVGTDDLQISDNTCYLSDIGLTGCRDNVIGMDKKMPIYRAMTGLNGHFEVPNTCKSILQMLVVELNEGKAIDAFKIKKYCDRQEEILTKAFCEL